MFDPARFDPPQHDRPGQAPLRWRGGALSSLILGAAAGLAVGFILMPWFVYARAWFGASVVTWLGAWVLAGLLVVLCWRAGCALIARLGWARLAWLAGILLVLLAVEQALWLAFGWVPFRPICLSNVRYEIVGRMNPVAVIHVEHWLREGWGPSGVTQDETGQLLVRPAIRSIGADYLMNYIDKEAAAFMEGPWDLERGWGYWPYNSVNPSSLIGRELMSLHR